MSESLTGRCDGCDAEHGYLFNGFSGHSFYYCSTCTPKMALFNAAHQHLEALMRETLSAFCAAYQDTPAASQVLSVAGLMAERIAEEFASEDVQSLPGAQAAD